MAGRSVVTVREDGWAHDTGSNERRCQCAMGADSRIRRAGGNEKSVRRSNVSEPGGHPRHFPQ